MFRLKSIRREIKETEEITAQRVVKRAAAKEQKMYQPAMLSGYKFEEPVNIHFLYFESDILWTLLVFHFKWAKG